MHKINFFRSVSVPDRTKLARYSKTPELGPKVLFFSGGTALNSMSRTLVNYTHNSIHLVTPFDSGGSTARLRDAFSMPAVGDMRSRLMALADQTIHGNPGIFNLFTYRLSKKEENEQLRNELHLMVSGHHFLVNNVPEPMRTIICRLLRSFNEKMPADFDLKGASIGNLILASGYLSNDRQMDPVIFIFSKLAEVRGTVRPILNTFLHLVAGLEDGTMVTGQHLLTGKETAPIKSRVRELYLSESLDNPLPCHPIIKDKTGELIMEAELICYPMGSFYSSIIANILPRGVGSAVAGNICPKIFIPNTGHDPEQIGTTLDQRVKILVDHLGKSCGSTESASSFLDFILIDPDHSLYQGGVDFRKIKDIGVKILEIPLTEKASKPYLSDQKLVETILSMI